jgi:hypothetical protein
LEYQKNKGSLVVGNGRVPFPATLGLDNTLHTKLSTWLNHGEP